MFSPLCIAAIKRHALADFPKESIGMVVDGEYRELENVAADQHNEAAFDERIPLYCGKGLNAIVHSHPATPEAYYPNIPSPMDQQTQIAFGIPFGIVVCNETQAQDPIWWGDGVPHPHWSKPIGFHWVLQDCYQRIRDLYEQELGIRLMNFVRGWGEWRELPGKPARSGYLENFKTAGFIEVDRPQKYDLGLCKFTELKVPSHAGVLLDGNMWLHHLADDDDPVNPYRLSTVEPIGRWLKYIEPRRGGRWLRYVGPRAT